MPTLISWNMQGNGRSKLSEAYSELISPRNDNILMIQEYGRHDEVARRLMINDRLIAEGEESFGSLNRNHHKFNVFSTPPILYNNIRCTTTLLIEDSYEILECNVFPPDYNINDVIDNRPVIFNRPVLYCICYHRDKPFEKYIFGTVHLTAYPPEAKDQLKIIDDVFKDQYDNNFKWIIMGDFNCEPKDIDQRILHSSPGSPTHWDSKAKKGKELDYAIFSNALRGQINVNIGGASRSGTVPLLSDHWPIHCVF